MSQRTFVVIRKDTNETDGVVNTHLDHLEDFEYTREEHELLTVPVDHPVFYEQRAWTAPRREVFGALWDRQLIRKPQEQIDAEHQAQETHHHPSRLLREIDVLLTLINELRAKVGDPSVTLDDVRSKESIVVDSVKGATIR